MWEAAYTLYNISGRYVKYYLTFSSPAGHHSSAGRADISQKAPATVLENGSSHSSIE